MTRIEKQFYIHYVHIVNKGIFGDSLFHVGKDKNPVDAWRFLSKTKYSMLAQIAEETITIATGIAGVERTFNSLRLIQTFTRCSLGPKTLDKLTYIYFNLKCLQTTFYCEEEDDYSDNDNQ
jgi:hypothetical protein